MVLLAPVAAVVVALVLLLFVLAGEQFIGFQRRLYAGAPFPISAVLSWIVSFQAAALDTIKGWAVVGIDAVGKLFLAIGHVWISLFLQALDTFESVVRLGATLRAVALTLYHQAERYTQLTADGIAASVIATTHYLEALIAAARTDATQGIDAVAHDLSAAVKSIDGTVARDVAGLAGTVDAGIAGLAHGLVTGIDGAERYAAGAVAAGVAGVEGDLSTAVGALQGTIDGVWRDTLGRIDAAEAAAAAGTTAAVGGVLSLIRSGVLATVTTINAELDDCVRPNCSWMKSLGTDLSSLASGLDIALLLAFLAEAIFDPALAAREIEDVVNPITDTLVPAMADFLHFAYT